METTLPVVPLLDKLWQLLPLMDVEFAGEPILIRTVPELVSEIPLLALLFEVGMCPPLGLTPTLEILLILLPPSKKELIWLPTEIVLCSELEPFLALETMVLISRERESVFDLPSSNLKESTLPAPEELLLPSNSKLDTERAGTLSSRESPSETAKLVSLLSTKVLLPF